LEKISRTGTESRDNIELDDIRETFGIGGTFPKLLSVCPLNAAWQKSYCSILKSPKSDYSPEKTSGSGNLFILTWEPPFRGALFSRP